MRGLVLFACACGATTKQPLDEPRTNKAEPEPFATATNQAVVKGRALLNGQPVTKLGIVAQKNFQMFALGERARYAQVRDGRFEASLDPGTWDLIIAGPGFARHVVLHQELRRGFELDLGDIPLRHGFTIKGEVIDTSAQPVPAAVITLEQDFSAPIDDTLTALAFGNHRTITDANGRYQIEGVTSTDLSGRDALLRASRPGLVSRTSRLGAGNATVRLVLEPAAIIEGSVTVRDGTEVKALSVSNRNFELVRATVTESKFRLEVPPGQYVVTLYASGAKQSVTAVAGQTSTLTFP